MSQQGARRRDDRGAAAVEFALLLPFLIFLVAGLIDFAAAFNAQIQVSQAAQAGARAAALGYPQSVVEARARGASPTLLSGVGGATAPAVNVTACSGGTTTVTVTHAYAVPIPLPGMLTSFNITEKAVTPCAS
jgi:Flp pilus assembly protein TadG